MTEEAGAKWSQGRRELDRLLDIKEAIGEIQGHPRHAEGQKAWEEDKYYRGYCERQLGIIGEAAASLVRDFDYETKHPEVPWRQIGGLRNILVHMYWGSDPKVLWSIVDKRVPELKERIDSWVEEKEKALKDEPLPAKREKKESKLSRKVRELAEKDKEKPLDRERGNELLW